MMKLALIAAVAEKGVIGNKGELPWKDRPYAKEDMDHFKRLTKHHVVIMGRKTYESLQPKYKPLPDRLNLVVTNRPLDSESENLMLCGSIDRAVWEAEHYTERAGLGKAFVIGGQTVYEQTIDRAHVLEITEIHKRFEGDAFFPRIDDRIWIEAQRDDRGPISFVSYRRNESI